MRLQPKDAGAHNRIDAGLGPPCCFVTAAMDLAMVSSAQRDRELVADFAAKRPALGETQMVGVTGLSAADQTCAPGDEFDVLSVANPPRLRDSQNALVDNCGPRPLNSGSWPFLGGGLWNLS